MSQWLTLRNKKWLKAVRALMIVRWQAPCQRWTSHLQAFFFCVKEKLTQSCLSLRPFPFTGCGSTQLSSPDRAACEQHAGENGKRRERWCLFAWPRQSGPPDADASVPSRFVAHRGQLLRWAETGPETHLKPNCEKRQNQIPVGETDLIFLS